MKPVISYKDLLSMSLSKKSRNYFEGIKRYHHCFSGDVKEDVANANKIITSIKNNNTGHSTVSMFKWAFNNFYGVKFNPKYIISRASEISKFTTRLTNENIRLIRDKYKQWIMEPIENGVPNYVKAVRVNRIKYYYVFETLLCSGMRIGELTSINFSQLPAHRVITSEISGEKLAEIIINTEKTCKKREIYIPIDAYNFFSRQERLKGNLIKDNFISFRRWAKLPFKLTAHVLRRTKASLMHECGVDINTIAMVLGNTPKTVMNHYIISSTRNYDACDIANCAVNGYIVKTNNLYFNKFYLSRR